MTNSELRALATRVTVRAVGRDELELAKHVLATVLNDDAPLTEKWLLAVGFVGERNCYPLTVHANGFTDGIGVQVVNPRLTVWFVSVGDRFNPIPVPKARGDVRRLCAALGVTLKESQ